MTSRVWTVPATVIRIIDADTLALELDLGWDLTLTENCRLLGVNAPELSTAEGKIAKAWVQALLPPGTQVTFVSRKREKYGRPLGDVILSSGVSLAALLVEQGHAMPMPG